MRHSLFFIMHLFLYSIPCTAQLPATFSATVQDKSGNALHGAHVIAYSAQEAPLAYTTTNKEGYFSLKIPAATTHIAIRHLGFNSVFIKTEACKKIRTITLDEQMFKLKEVAVTAERISESGDTLTYSVAGFKQAQDRSIADVINKMPGLEVKPNGVIEYQGKAINNLYIEGLDLMGSQYSLASSNIPAGKVESIQVLENHQKIKSRRHMGFSEQAALNIVLKEDAKSVWSGLADLGLGYAGTKENLTYDNRIMGMQFSKKFQTLMMYKNNRTGADIGSEVQDIADLGNYKAENGLISMTEPKSLGFEKQRYTFNASHLLAGNWLWKTGKNADLRMQLSGFNDKERQRNESSITYLTIEGIPMVTEKYDGTGRNNEIKGELCYTLNADRTYLRSSTSVYADWDSGSGEFFYNGNSTNLMVKPYKRVLSEDLNLSHTTDRGDIWQLNSSTGNTYLPGQLLTIRKTTQQLDINLFSTKNNIRFSRKIGKHFLNNTVGFDYQHQNINRLVWQIAQPYWESSAQMSFGKHQLTGSVKAGYAHQTYNNTSTKHAWTEPSLAWRYKPSSKSTLSFNYMLTTRPFEGISIVDMPLFTSYRNLYEGNGKTGMRHSHIVSMNYTYRNPVNGIFFNWRPMYIHSSGNILYKNELETDTFIKSATDKRYDTDSYTIGSRLAKTYTRGRTNIGLNGTFNSTGYSTLSSNKIQHIRINTYTASLDYSFRPLRWWTIEGKSGVTTNCRHHTNPTVDWSHFLDLNFIPMVGWMISMDNELYHSNIRNFGVNHFCDIALSYKAEEWEISLLANNIVGTSTYKRISVSATAQSYELTYLRPREIMLKFSIGF